MNRIKINHQKFDQLLAESEIIVVVKNRPKVARRGDGFLKLFNLNNQSLRRKYLNPISSQFVRNARKIAALGIVTIQPTEWFRCLDSGFDLVGYPSVPGTTVYDTFESNQDLALLPPFAAYVAELHLKNFYFRAGHSDNYLVQDNGNFAIIDMDNVRFKMTRRRRAKNLNYLLYHAEKNGRDLFTRFGILKFLQHYFRSANTPESEQQYIIRYLEKQGRQVV